MSSRLSNLKNTLVATAHDYSGIVCYFYSIAVEGIVFTLQAFADKR